jgi:type IV secretion system protein VirD4
MRSGQQLWGSVEDSYLYLGPPRSGKGVHLIIPQTLAAPGPVLVTSTRNDVVRHTATLRATAGPVVVFDPQQQATRRSLPRLRWSPHRGCDDPLVAIGRARAFAAACKFAVGTTTNGDYWSAMTEAVLRCYLHAAALSGRPARELMLWSSQPTDPTPVRILRGESTAAPGWAEELAAQASADPRQRDSVWSGVRRAFDCLADPRVLDACSPADDDAFDPAEFLTGNGTLYLLGDTDSQLSVAPLICALLEDLLGVARRAAAHSAGGRLDPPLLLLLDEAANIAPIPSLPNLLADGGGTGITTVAVLQSLAQARHRWGQPAAEALWDAATTKVVLGGLAQADDLQRISRLAGDIDEPAVTRTTGPGGGSMSVADRRLPALPVEMLRTMPPGQAIVLARHTAPVLTRLRPWMDLADAAAIRADAAAQS